MATTFAVPDGRVAMAATLYTGNGTTQTVNNAVNTVSFQPDLVWVKNRSAGYNHVLQDSIRGATAAAKLGSNLLEEEGGVNLAPYGNVSAFNSNGFSLVAGSIDSRQTNAGGNNFIGWQWKAGGTAVSNTAGTITSTVSANTTAGFSVVTYTGTGANATVGHGLGVVPGMIIIKSRSVATNWIVYHSSIAPTAHLALNITDVVYTDVAFNNTAPTNSIFSIGPNGYSVNNPSATYVAYCWAPVAGYSAFGSYTGNNSADGPFIYTGFRPRWILIKSSTVATSWYLLDSARETYNEEKIFLYPDLGQADSPQAYGVDFLSNGFKIRAPTGYGLNNASATYIYAAFAENPLKYANAR